VVPTWEEIPSAAAASIAAVTTSWCAAAGYSIGAYRRDAPSWRSAESKIATSPIFARCWSDPHVPARRNVVAPTRASSSRAIAVEGAPIPVEVQLIGTPR